MQHVHVGSALHDVEHTECAVLRPDPHFARTCRRYIELNLVRTAVFATPRDSLWKSYRSPAEGHDDPRPTPHPAFLALDPDPVARRTADRALVEGCVSDEPFASIRTHLARRRAYGSDRFREAIERQLGRSVEIVPRGRPKQSRTTSDQ